MGPGIHADVKPLAAFVGRWLGSGRGTYPTTLPFDYAEEIVFESVGEPYLLYSARSWAEEDGSPIHFERGFLMPGASPGAVEFVLAHPVGVTEISTGTVSDTTMHLRSTTVDRAPGGSAVSGLVRRYTVEGDTLTYEVDMAMDEVPMVFHVGATLRRTS